MCHLHPDLRQGRGHCELLSPSRHQRKSELSLTLHRGEKCCPQCAAFPAELVAEAAGLHFQCGYSEVLCLSQTMRFEPFSCVFFVFLSVLYFSLSPIEQRKTQFLLFLVSFKVIIQIQKRCQSVSVNGFLQYVAFFSPA